MLPQTPQRRTTFQLTFRPRTRENVSTEDSPLAHKTAQTRVDPVEESANITSKAIISEAGTNMTSAECKKPLFEVRYKPDGKIVCILRLESLRSKDIEAITA